MWFLTMLMKQPSDVCDVVTQHLALKKSKLWSSASLVSGRQVIVGWKRCNSPTFTRWNRDTLFFIILEKIKHIVQSQLTCFN